MPVNPKLITLPLCITTYNPTSKCKRFRDIGAITPTKTYSII